MAIRAKTGHQRCSVCRLHPSICMCEHLPRLDLQTRLTVVMHFVEVNKTTNTGSLALGCLQNSRLSIFKGSNDEPDPPIFDEGEEPLLLFPSVTAVSLDQWEPTGKPVRLIVPDGTWRQASKIRRRRKDLVSLRCVTLPPGPPTIYKLRNNPAENTVSTMEAIARAMGVLEGPQVQEQLEAAFTMMMDRFLWMKGKKSAAEVRGGLPEGAKRHDPTSGLARLNRPEAP